MDLMSVLTILEKARSFNKDNNGNDNVNQAIISDMVLRDNIVKISKDLVVSPPFVISKSLKHHEYIDQTVQTLTETFSSFYMQAFAVLSKVNRIEIVRSNIDALKTGMESYFDGFETETGFLKLTDSYDLGMEDDDYYLPRVKSTYSIGTSKSQLHHPGLTVEVELNIDGTIVKLPIVINPVILFADPMEIIKIATGGFTKDTFMERFYEWRSGGIDFLDFLLGLDIIRNYYKLKIKNDDEAVKSYIDRLNSKYVTKLVKGSPNSSLNTIYVVTKQEADEIAKLFGGKLTSKSLRKKLFERTSSIFLCYLDDEWEELVLYIDSIDSESHIPYRRLARRSNNEAVGKDLTKIFTDIILGKPPKL